MPSTGGTPSVVYLSQVPYTGLDLGPVGTIVYWIALVIWSLAAAYLILFWIVPFVSGKLSAFGASVKALLHAQSLAAAGTASGVAPVVKAVADPNRNYSSYQGFKSFAAEGAPLTVDDIVKGLSRTAGKQPFQEEMRQEPARKNVEPIYEKVEPIEEVPRTRREHVAEPIPGEVPMFIEALLDGNRDTVFSTIRGVIRSGADAEAFLTQVVCALDDAYRARLESTPVHPEIAQITKNYATPVLENVVTALTTAIDSSYSQGITGVKLALTRVLAILGA